MRSPSVYDISLELSFPIPVGRLWVQRAARAPSMCLARLHVPGTALNMSLFAEEITYDNNARSIARDRPQFQSEAVGMFMQVKAMFPIGRTAWFPFHVNANNLPNEQPSRYEILRKRIIGLDRRNP